ncbi:MAG: glycosyltransferase [Oscillospiraceae bacterium]|nr:glycosyltransferase [Oscillospiraceae bacterium]
MVYYIGFYDTMTDGHFSRAVSPAAVRKMDYVIDKIAQLGKDITVVSTARANAKTKGLQNKVRVNDRIKIDYFPLGNFSAKLLRSASEKLMPLWLFLYCLFRIGKDDKVVYYHSPVTDGAVRIAKKLKKFDLIAEIEEIYSLVWNRNRRDTRSEQRFLRQCTEKAIVVSESLKNYLKHPTAVVSYGSYATCTKPKIRRNDDDIMLVYSGAFDKVKGGAFAALEIMQHLPENYRLVLSGKCSDALLPELHEKIAQINASRGEDNVRFAGLLPEEDFEQLLRSADIALNLQNEGAFSGFLFPSKLLTYLCYDLPVVTTPGESITASSLSDILYITGDYDAESIVQTILSVDIDHEDDYRRRLTEMDAQFVRQLGELLQ